MEKRIENKEEDISHGKRFIDVNFLLNMQIKIKIKIRSDHINRCFR